jgi:hypothetical protein
LLSSYCRQSTRALVILEPDPKKREEKKEEKKEEEKKGLG